MPSKTIDLPPVYMNRVEKMKKYRMKRWRFSHIKMSLLQKVIMESTSLYHRYKSYNNDYYTILNLYRYKPTDHFINTKE